MKQCKECLQPVVSGGYRDSALEADVQVNMKAVAMKMFSAKRYQPFLKRHKKKFLFPFVLVGLLFALFPGLFYFGKLTTYVIDGKLPQIGPVDFWAVGLVCAFIVGIVSFAAKYLLNLFVND